MLNNKSILITGGTGSFGRAFIAKILSKYPKIKKLIILSRDEFKQFELAKLYPESKFKQIRYFLGDVRDKERLNIAFKDVDIVIHAAALKHVPIAEYNPTEFIATNVNGAMNVVNAAYNNKVSNVIALSTDKASSPINLYGATKLCSDKLFISINRFYGDSGIKFSVVRYGNVMGSRGSVLPFFLNESKKGTLPITHENMTRFNILMDQCLETVLYTIKNAVGGEIVIPKMPSMKMTDLAKAINSKCRIKLIGIRPGEKIHEELISESDSKHTFDIGKFYIVLPYHYMENLKKFRVYLKNGKKVKSEFSYNSKDNKDFLTVEQIKKIIKTNFNNFDFNS